ncbi:MAG: hypothetical protein IID17_14225 [Nitrospinae bacterium]|nr:hypothetical protein [Nitrospinota bacterium]
MIRPIPFDEFPPDTEILEPVTAGGLKSWERYCFECPPQSAPLTGLPYWDPITAHRTPRFLLGQCRVEFRYGNI